MPLIMAAVGKVKTQEIKILLKTLILAFLLVNPTPKMAATAT
jgi:hypothetical protein